MADESAKATVVVSTTTASDTVTVKVRSLTIDFIFEVAHGGGETSVQGHVGIAERRSRSVNGNASVNALS